MVTLAVGDWDIFLQFAIDVIIDWCISKAYSGDQRFWLYIQLQAIHACRYIQLIVLINCWHSSQNQKLLHTIMLYSVSECTPFIWSTSHTTVNTIIKRLKKIQTVHYYIAGNELCIASNMAKLYCLQKRSLNLKGSCRESLNESNSKSKALSSVSQLTVNAGSWKLPLQCI